VSFELFVDRRRGRGRPADDSWRATVSSAYVAISPGAYEALGRPAVVELLADRKRGTIIVQASHGNASRKLTAQSSGWFRVSARGFKTWAVEALHIARPGDLDLLGTRGVKLRPLSPAAMLGRETGAPLALMGDLVGSSRVRRAKV
jgi:hypothetical protein